MFSTKKPYTSVTVFIERLTSEQYEEDDLGEIPDLVEAIKIQATGPTEVARAIRKKLKYGSVHRQLRALTILDGLIQNAGPRFQRTFVDEPLLERLRVCATSDMSDVQVRNKCKVLFAQWAASYRKTPGLERICGLHKQQPRRKEPVTQAQSKVLRETETDPFEDGEDERPKPTPVASSSHNHSSQPSISSSYLAQYEKARKDKEKEKEKARREKDKKTGKRKVRPFNLEAEKDKMKANIAESSVASTNLLNALKFVNREKEQVSDNVAAVKLFETCKLLRRHILRYIQHIDSEQWLGALIQANDNLVQALMTFEQLDRSIDADSDSEDELAEQAHAYRLLAEKGKENQESMQAFQQLNISSPSSAAPSPVAAAPAVPQPAMPPRPIAPVQEKKEEEEEEDDDDEFVEEDENDPFADRNAVVTPKVEKGEPTWTVV